MKADVVIIGGGPAGLSAGIALAQLGSSVLVCEGALSPGSKPCGEGLLPAALRELVSLGLPEAELLSAGRPLRGVRYISEAGRRAEGRFAAGPGLGVSRSSLYGMLRQLAERTPRLGLLHASARLLTPDSGRLQVQVDGHLLTPRLVIGADGLNSATRKAAGLRWRRPAPFRYGLRQHYRVRPWTDHVEVYWSAGAEAYVTPTAADEINVALLWQAAAQPSSRTAPKRVPDLRATFPELARRLAGATAVGDSRGSGPLRVEVSTPAADGLVLLGDAAGYLDAVTGEGVGLTVAKARALACSLAPALRSGHSQLRLRQLKPYLAAARELERDHVRLTRLLLWVRRWPWLMERAIASLAEDAKLFEHFLAANQGQASPFHLPRGSLLGLARNLARAPAPPSALGEAHALRD